MVSAPQYHGVFDPGLAPAVQICVYTADGCGSVIADFTATGGPGVETVRVDQANQLYIVNWHTNDAGLDPARTYRIRVLLEGLELGFVDVDVVSSGKELRSVQTNEYIPLLNGTTLPIKFRIERGMPFRVAFSVQPTATTAGEDITPAVEVALQDASGNLFTDVPSNVTLAIGANPTGGRLSGNAAAVTVNGIASFTDLAIDRDGAPYTLTASSQGLLGAISHPFTIVSFVALTTGFGHVCGLTTGQAAYCWGANDRGQLGRGYAYNTFEPVPSPVAGGIAFASLSASGNHTCGVSVDGSGYCWGENAGQLGDGTDNERWAPVRVSGGLTLAGVSAGRTHTCGVTTQGAAYCWGDNGAGELGDGDVSEPKLSPVPVFGGLLFVQVAAGGDITCGITTDHASYCWGRPRGAYATFLDQPNRVPGDLAFGTITAGVHYACGVASAAAYCWGVNEVGQLGDGTTFDLRDLPVPVSGGLGFTSVSTGDAHACAVTSDGAAYCWGDNMLGQLGDGTTNPRNVPMPVTGGLVFSSVSAGGVITCGLSNDGGTYCWGTSGNLGYATAPVRLSLR